MQSSPGLADETMVRLRLGKIEKMFDQRIIDMISLRVPFQLQDATMRRHAVFSAGLVSDA